jgi:hypothetical protein
MAQQNGPLGQGRIFYNCATMLLIYSGRDKFLDTLAQRCYTPFLLYLSTRYGVILIRETQYTDY